MRLHLLIICLLFGTFGNAQDNFIPGHFVSLSGSKSITLSSNHTFEYYNRYGHPKLPLEYGFLEKGKWEQHGDTIILNPHLKEKPFIEHSFHTRSVTGDTGIYLTLNHVKRYFNPDGSIQKVDTVRVKQADYFFNNPKENDRVRVAEHINHCLWSGAPATQIEVDSNTFKTITPVGKLQKITIGCYELKDSKTFPIDDTTVNHMVLNIYANHYLDGQIRSEKILIKNSKAILTVQKDSGKFYPDTWLDHNSKMKRCEPGHKWNTWERMKW